MIIVSDTTPLRYLVEIEHVGILPRLFDSIYTCPKVLEELRHPAAPTVVRAWATTPPDWLTVKAPAQHIKTPSA